MGCTHRRPLGFFSSAYSVSVFTDWVEPTIREVLVKTRVENGTTEAVVAEALFGSRRLDAEERQALIELTGMDNLTVRGEPGPWCDRLPHFRIDATPSHGEEIQTEYMVPRELAGQAIAAVRRIGDQIRGPLVVTELRTVAADDLWLSPCTERDSLCIHFTWHDRPAEVLARIPLIEAALTPFEVRPHWGKVHTLEAFDADALYPRAADFRDVATEFDPSGRFRNDFLDRTVWRQASRLSG